MPIKIPATVTDIQEHGRHTWTIVLQSARRLPLFQPGQFTHLALDHFDPTSHWPESRVFSIASSPTKRDQLRLTYTVNGQFTQRMENELVIGKQVWLKLPYGEFFIDTVPQKRNVLIAGGTGVTPYISYVESLIENQSQPNVVIAYGAETHDLLIYKPILEKFSSVNPNAVVLYFCEKQPEPDVIEGRISFDHILPVLDNPLECIYYISGPKAMISQFSAKLAQLGVSATDIRVDAWA